MFIDDHLYTILDILRHKLGKPVIITSGYRTPEWNAKCGGAKYSYHMRGMAADIRVDGMSAKEIANKLNEIVPDECGIIVYNGWVHFDVRKSKYRKGFENGTGKSERHQTGNRSNARNSRKAG